MSLDDELTKLTHATHLDTTVLATHLTAALHALHDSVAGYPTSTPGAAPATPHTTDYDPDEATDGRVQLTPVERNAGTPDRAQRALDELNRNIRRAQRHTARAAAIATHWALPGIDGTTVARRLAAIPNPHLFCRTPGCDNPHADDRTECSWCNDFRQTYGTPPTTGLLDIRARRKVTINDIERNLDRDQPGWRTKRPKPKKPKSTP